MERSTFFKRKGTTDVGKLYEELVVADLVVDLVFDSDVSNFNVTLNDADFGAFDDIVLEVETTEKSFYALQLKHVKTRKKSLLLSQLSSKTGDFSLNKYMESYIQMQQKEGYKFILFTNLSFTSNKNLKITIKERIFELKAVKTTEKIIRTGSCFRFETINLSPDLDENYKSFFENFLLVTNQPNVKETKQNIVKKIKKQLHSKDGVEEYLQFINKWNMREGEKVKLNKYFMPEIIVLSTLTKRIKPLAFGDTSEETNLLREAIDNFKCTSVNEENYHRVKTIWSKIKDETETVGKIRECYQLTEEDDDTISRLMWVLDRCPLILTENKQTSKAIKLCPKKTFLFLWNNQNERTLPDGVFRNLSDLTQTPQYDKILNTFKLSIQGKEPITLKELMGDNKDFNSVVTTDILVKISTGSFLVGEPKEDISQPYINRFLSENKIDINFLKSIDSSTTIVLDCVNRLDIQSNMSNFNLVDIPKFLRELNEKSREHIDSELSYRPPYHSSPRFQNFVSGSNVFFTQSFCSENDFLTICEYSGSNCHHLRLLNPTTLQWIRSHGDTKELERHRLEDDVEETTFHGKKPENHINLVIGDSGMGKSKLLKNFKNNCPPKTWTVFMSPKEMTRFCEKKGDVVEFLLEEKSEFDQQVIKFLIREGNVAFFWDGLDEISKSDMETIVAAIKEISHSHWITANIHLKTFLEQNFSVLARTIRPFNDAQLAFYFRLSNMKNELQKKCALLQMVLKDSDVLSTPLQISIITDLTTTRKRTTSVPDLFEHIIENKFDRYYCEKAEVENPNDALKEILMIHKRSMYKKYQGAALKMFISPESFTQLDIKIEDFQAEADCLGLVKETFLNKTFAEFLVATYFIQHPEKWKNVVFNTKETKIQFFYDLLVKRDHGEFVNGQPTFILPVEKQGDYYVIDNQTDFFSPKEEPDFVEAAAYSELLNEDSISEESISVLYYCTKFGYDEVFERFSTIPLVKTKKEDSSLLHLAVTCNRENILKKLLSFDAYKASVNDKNRSGKTALYKACKNGFYNISLLLLNSGADINLSKRNGTTLLYTACLHNHPDIVKLLINHKCDINIGKDKGPTPLHAACWNGHRSVVEELLKHGADIDAFFEGTPLYVAARNNHSAVVNLLLESNADINRAQEDGVTPLFIASQEGHEQNVKLLLEANADINLCTKSGESPLYIACQNGHETVARMLIKYGGDINKTTTNGWTALHIAAQRNHLRIVELLVEAGAAVDVDNSHGKTPIDIAVLHGYDHIAQKLRE